MSLDQRQAQISTPYLNPDGKEDWFLSVLGLVFNVGKSDVVLKSVRWRDLKKKYVHSFFVETLLNGNNHKLIFNIYNITNSNYYESEKVYFESSSGASNVLSYIGGVDIDGFMVNAFYDYSVGSVTLDNYKANINQLLVQQWSLVPSDFSRIKESNVYSNIQYIKANIIVLKTLAHLPEEISSIEWLSSHGEEVREYFLKFPCSVDNPEISSAACLYNKTGEVGVALAPRVEIQPVGSFLWRIKNRKGIDVNVILDHLKIVRSDCDYLMKHDLYAAAEYYGLIKNIQNGLYSDAIGCAVKLKRFYLSG
jgi:hypothetical protein